MPGLLRKIFLPEGELDVLTAPDTAGYESSTGDLVGTWQSAPVALALFDGERVRDWNHACDVLLREAVGRSEMARHRWLTGAVVRLLATGRTSEVLAAASEEFSLEVRLGPVVLGNDQRVVALRESHAGRRNETDLAETVSTLSHELRTPLTSMKSSLNLVLAGETGPVTDEQSHFLGMTMRNIDRLERLVSDLLDASRTQAGEPMLHRRETDLGPVLREAVQMQEAAARQAGLELDYKGLPASLVAHVDPDKVVQILANVVGNSVKYTPPGGLVRVWLEARPQPDKGLGWQLAKAYDLPFNIFNLVVEDSGVGMTPEDQDRIFEPWFRGREDRQQSAPGTGLGLHITRALVEAHGGRIRLASEPERGTTVWIRLPRDPATEELLQGVRQLRAMAGQARMGHTAAPVAVLDGRPDTAVRSLAEGFLRHWPGVGERKIVGLAEDLVATVAPDPAAWADAWENFCDECGRAETAPRWRFLKWDEPESNKRSISPELNRTQ